MNLLVVISGCSGGGKSAIISVLSDMGYTVISEIGRQIVQEQIMINGDVLPLQKPREFSELLISKSVSAFHYGDKIKDTKDNVIFFDRSFLEGISFYKSLNVQGSDKYDHLISELRYFPIIFMTPPWKEIYSQDDERQHSFDDAVAEYDRLMKDFSRYGYEIMQLPKISIQERVEFLLFELFNFKQQMC